MRKRLVTIQRVSKLTPIPGADRIEIAECKGLGWQVIVSKEQFKVGPTCAACVIGTQGPLGA